MIHSQRARAHPQTIVSIISAFCTCLLLAFAQPSLAANMDAKLNMAQRLLTEVDGGLASLQAGDVGRYNSLSAKLTKAGDLLKTTESKAHPDYVPAIKQWGAAQQSMAATAQRWQAAKAQGEAARTAAAAASTASASQQPSTNPATNIRAAGANPDQILAKYQRDNRPKLSGGATPDEAQSWAERMKALQTSELQSDLAALNGPGVSANDRNRVSRWINGSFQTQITDDVRAQFNQSAGAVTMGLQLADLINAIPAEDKTRAYNFANGSNGDENAATLQNGLHAIMVSRALSEVFPELTNGDQADELATLAATQQRFIAMREDSLATGAALAKLPKKQRAKKPDFLAPIAQEFWLGGRVFASIDAKGNVWIGSTEVGDIESNGKIWVRGNELGAIEPDGEVWFRGNSVGSLEDNGEVWRRGSHVGTIQNNGKVWIGGNANGEITPFQGEWKRAAILYYFKDFFAAAL